RSFQTRVGALLGTPAYMSPEQARGENNVLDERSDVYALAVVCHELLTLRHYLQGFEEIDAVLEGVKTRGPGHAALGGHPRAEPVAVELGNVFARGLQKKREDRYASVSEMIEALHRVQNGTFDVSCPITLTKRALFEFGRVVDAYPRVIG